MAVVNTVIIEDGQTGVLKSNGLLSFLTNNVGMGRRPCKHVYKPNCITLSCLTNHV